MKHSNIQHFYIPEDQSIYLLSHKDAKKLKDWFALCITQLEKLGYRDIHLIGKGAYGFAFCGSKQDGQEYVFKFSRITLPQHIQDRLEEEAYMLSLVNHSAVPAFVDYQRIKRQAVLVMQRARGEDLEQYSLRVGPLSARLVVKITTQLVDILNYLREFHLNGRHRPLVHGDIKPSNLVWDAEREQVSLIDWGSSVFAQLDEHGQPSVSQVTDLMSDDMQQTNARLGDVYFIGDEQLSGALSSPRFDEQGLASTIYALASGQSSRFGRLVITPLSLNLPIEFAKVLYALMSNDAQQRKEAGDYLMNNAHRFKHLVFIEQQSPKQICLLPTWIYAEKREIDTVVYSSRKSFLRQQGGVEEADFKYVNDAQFERYYKNFMQGMGETEKAFLAAISRLGKFPVVGGIAIRWQADGLYVDSSLNIYNSDLQHAFDRSVDNVITLARAITTQGVFKCCMFNAKHTLHIERDDEESSFIPDASMHFIYDKSKTSLSEDQSRMHSYFEDGDDPDELLRLPNEMIDKIQKLNAIHHTGCIIFEALPLHLKVHNYYTLLDHSKEAQFKQLLSAIIGDIPKITGAGISGFMKLPYKDTRFFQRQAKLTARYYPRNPYQPEQNKDS